MSTLEQRLYLGDRAKEVLENEAFMKAYSDVETHLVESWKNLPSTSQSADARDRIHLSLTLLRKVHACLIETMDTGKLAKLEMEHQRSVRERVRDGWNSLIG